MNALFSELRSELKKEDYVKVDRYLIFFSGLLKNNNRYKLQTKAGLLLATIDALKGRGHNSITILSFFILTNLATF